MQIDDPAGFKAYLKTSTPDYIHDIELQWPDIEGCIEQIDERSLREGVSLCLSAMLLGGEPMEAFYHVCLDGFAQGYRLCCGVGPTDALVLKYSPELVMIAYDARSHLRTVGTINLIASLGISAILRGYFASLEQIPKGGDVQENK